ncbi:MAG: class I SAM-dependent methyltransferase [Geminicoccaceae bacterium]|jgi:ubiquinone/menaquinone biosynthesis C-methylase UbiE|nr:class I SAM-dependent methyltransferase [Geminicoccaceae bacterium]HRY24304.1 class I SAM-dependent methyltransferase [Geminicoccaceae bacterium]
MVEKATALLNLYDRLILPWLIHRGMADERFRPLREELVAGTFGRVLEIGIGSGLNLPFYGRAVEEVVGVDPSAALLERAGRQSPWLGFRLRLLRQSAEHLPFDAATFDGAVVSWALCSISDPLVALAEVRRVLKPGGRLHFVEHGLAAAPGTARWQTRLTPLWRRCAGGCRLDGRPDALLAAAGFRPGTLETGDLVPGPRLLTWHYRGTAVA